MNKLIFISGVSCVGKTTIGKLLSKNIGYNFFDLDEEIEKILNQKEEKYYLNEIKKDITYFKTSYKKANLQIDISGLDVVAASNQIEHVLTEYIRSPVTKN